MNLVSAVAVTICFHVVWIVDYRCYIFCCFGFYIRTHNYCPWCILSVTAICQFLYTDYDDGGDDDDDDDDADINARRLA